MQENIEKCEDFECIICSNCSYEEYKRLKIIINDIEDNQLLEILKGGKSNG